MIHNRPLTHNRSFVWLMALIVLIAVTAIVALALAPRGTIQSSYSNAEAGQAIPVDSYDARAAMDAWAARYEGLAATYAAQQRALEAETDRYQAQAEMYNEANAERANWVTANSCRCVFRRRSGRRYLPLEMTNGGQKYLIATSNRQMTNASGSS